MPYTYFTDLAHDEYPCLYRIDSDGSYCIWRQGEGGWMEAGRWKPQYMVSSRRITHLYCLLLRGVRP